VFGDRGQQLLGARLFEQQRAGARAHREDHQAAESEGEAERGAAGEDVVGVRSQDVLREGVRYRQDVAVEVHTALGAAGGAGRERDEGDVVGGGGHGGVRLVGGSGVRPATYSVQEVVGGVAAVRRDPQPGDLRLREVVHGPDVAQRVPGLRDLAHGGQLVGALLGEHGDGDRARLQDGQPARGQPGRGGPAQQDTVAGHHAELGGQDVRDPVHSGAQIAVRP
jgi:hypothetical protein